MEEKRVGIIGWPIEHSLSPAMHNAAFKALGLTNWTYDRMAIPPDIASHAVREPKRHGYVGINVTIPFKEKIMQFVQPDEKARAIGAVNTIDFRDDTGTNTDVDGFIDDLRAHDVEVAGRKVLVLGAGGAARAAVYGLWQAGADVVVVNRTLANAQEMLTRLTFSAGVRDILALTLDEAVDWGPDFMVNTTSAGMHPHLDSTPWIEGLPVPRGIILYDMVYRPAETALMRQVASQGGRAIGGLGMLVRQGALSFQLWTGIEPPIDVMFEAVRAALAADRM